MDICGELGLALSEGRAVCLAGGARSRQSARARWGDWEKARVWLSQVRRRRSTVLAVENFNGVSFWANAQGRSRAVRETQRKEARRWRKEAKGPS